MKSREWLINPVKKIARCLNPDVCKAFPMAGESALSELSMLSSPSVEVRACYEKDNRLKDLTVVEDDGWTVDDNYIKLEIWKYDPCVLSSGKTVDVISLGLSLADVNDERVEGEMQSLMAEAEWQ